MPNVLNPIHPLDANQHNNLDIERSLSVVMDQLYREESLDFEHVEKNRIFCVVCTAGETTCSG